MGDSENTITASGGGSFFIRHWRTLPPTEVSITKTITIARGFVYMGPPPPPRAGPRQSGYKGGRGSGPFKNGELVNKHTPMLILLLFLF